MSNSPLLGNTQLHQMVRFDARREILESVGDMGAVEVFGNQVIVAPYVHSGIVWMEKYGFPLEERISLERLYELYDSGTTLLNPTAAKESIFTGMVYLVIKLGDECTERLNCGDWVFTLQENTRQISITSPTARKSRVLKEVGVNYAAGWPGKLVFETDIYGRIPHQDQVV